VSFVILGGEAAMRHPRAPKFCGEPLESLLRSVSPSQGKKQRGSKVRKWLKEIQFRVNS
jgi:hypothetical protein